MTEHYFTSDPAVPSQETAFSQRLRGMDFVFVTDRGVFSRERVDYGSQLLIESMALAAGDRVLDLGCGYGPIGTVAGRLVPGGRVYLVDVNGRAVQLARTNLARNEVANGEARVGDGTAAVPGLAFDHVLMNPPFRAGKPTVHRLIREARAALVPGGSLWVVVGNKQGAPSLKRFLQEQFGRVQDVDRSGGFHVYRAVQQP